MDYIPCVMVIFLSKRSNETQVSNTLKRHHKVFISRSIQNGWAFKMVVVSTGCALAFDLAFNFLCYFISTFFFYKSASGHFKSTAQ